MRDTSKEEGSSEGIHQARKVPSVSAQAVPSATYDTSMFEKKMVDMMALFRSEIEELEAKSSVQEERRK